MTLNSGNILVTGFSSLSSMYPGTSLASTALKTLQEAEGWSFMSYGVSDCH